MVILTAITPQHLGNKTKHNYWILWNL